MEVKESQPVPRTRVPELRKTTLTMDQIDRLHRWDVFIEVLDTKPPPTLRERWEAKDREFIANRDREIGWKPRK